MSSNVSGLQGCQLHVLEGIENLNSVVESFVPIFITEKVTYPPLWATEKLLASSHCSCPLHMNTQLTNSVCYSKLLVYNVKSGINRYNMGSGSTINDLWVEAKSKLIIFPSEKAFDNIKKNYKT